MSVRFTTTIAFLVVLPLLVFLRVKRDKPAHVVRIAARGEGRSTVTCKFARPWDTKPTETRIYEVRIEF